MLHKTDKLTTDQTFNNFRHERQVGYGSLHANIGSISTSLLQSRYDYGASLAHWRVPSRSDALHILIMYGRSSVRNCLRMFVGSGSRSQDLDGAAVMFLDVSLSVQLEAVYRGYCGREERHSRTSTRCFTNCFNVLDGKFKKVLTRRNIAR